MTEGNATPEAVAIDALNDGPSEPKTFNLTDWVTGGTKHRLRKTATLYLDANLADEIAEAEQEIADLERSAAGQESLGENLTHDAEARYAELLEKIKANKATVEVYALIDTEIKEAKEKAGFSRDSEQAMKDIKWWYQAFAMAATMEGEKLTAEQWEAVHKTVGAQFTKVMTAYNKAATVDVTPSFRRSGNS